MLVGDKSSLIVSPLTCASSKAPGVGNIPCHIVDCVATAQRKVTRTTFASEFTAAADGSDHASVLALTVHELTGMPPPTLQRAARLRCEALGNVPEAVLKTINATQLDIARDIAEVGSEAVNIVLVIDALSVFSAVTAITRKVPTEKGLLVLF